jgi:hypothetical protein
LETEENHANQQKKAQERATVATTTRILGFKVRIMNFKHRTPFPSGTMTRRTVGRKAHAWPEEIAMRF